jgi:WD40 repeat protein
LSAGGFRLLLPRLTYVQVSLDYSTAYQSTLIGHKGSVTALAIQESTGHLLSSSLDSKVCLWDYDQVDIHFYLRILKPLAVNKWE